MTQELIRSLPVSDTIKAYLIGEEGGFRDKHRFYINLTQYYAPAFTFSTSGQLTSLSKASYLYFRSLLLVDSIFDKGDTKNIMVLLPIYEESIKSLSWLFSEEHHFWKKFNLRKNEYYSAIIQEKKLNSAQGITKSQFEDMANGKSAVCYSIIDAMVELAEIPIDVTLLTKSLQHIHIGFQYVDDVDDFNEDLKTGQRTYAHSLVENILSGMENIDDSEKHKHLYLSGVAQELITYACNHFELARQIAVSYELTELVQFLNNEISIRINQIKEIDLLIGKTRIKAGLSYKLVAQEWNIDTAIHDATQFLSRSINADNLFEDFTTTAGQGVTWATAFAGLQLSNVPEAKCIVSRILPSILKIESYAYNNSVMEDGDTLNFVIWFLRIQNQDIPRDLLEKWLRYNSFEGGWSSYISDEEIKFRLGLDDHSDVSGWLLPTLCVSSVALNVLLLFPELLKHSGMTKSYLINNAAAESHWQSYWWTSDVYATAFAVISLAGYSDCSALVQRSIKWIADQQNKDGSWSSADGISSAYFTALAIQAFIKSALKGYLINVNNAQRWLLRNQTEDGSWLSTRSLRIPATDIMDPSKIKRWRKSSFGVNVMVEDHQRIFTTSTAIKALHLFRSANNLEA